MITKPNILNENFSTLKQSPNFNDIYSNEAYDYLNDYNQIHKFFIENTVPKYNLKQCLMVKDSLEPGIDTEYYFFIKENLSSREFSKLSLKINFDLYYFCRLHNNPSFYKTLIIVSR